MTRHLLHKTMLEHMTRAYDVMKSEALPRNGLWLESQGYDIEFLVNYEQVVLYYETQGLVKIAEKIGVSYQKALNIMAAMKACGFIHQLKKGVYVLLEEPSEEAFEESKRRAAVPWNRSKYKTGPRAFIEDRLIGVFAQMDNLQTQITELQRRLEDGTKS